MLRSILQIVVACLFITSLAEAECETGWIPYKDESCIKAFTDVLTYDEAKLFCVSQGDEQSGAGLVTVKEPEMQQLLVTYTDDKYENFWLGARYDDISGQFKWVDGDTLTYTNWAEGFPRNNTDSGSCIQFIPVNAKKATKIEGKWQDAVCQRRNLAMCQRDLAWSLQDATREIRKLRKELEAVNSRVVPVGSIYIEYYNQPSPVAHWPTLTWENVTSSYAGLFFRAEGGESESWGTNQMDCAPRITETEHDDSTYSDAFFNPMRLPTNGWSEYARTGHYSGIFEYTEGTRFYVKGCEVRPKNQAIRIWKRLA